MWPESPGDREDPVGGRGTAGLFHEEEDSDSQKHCFHCILEMSASCHFISFKICLNFSWDLFFDLRVTSVFFNLPIKGTFQLSLWY